MDEVTFEIVDLAGLTLGETTGNTILIDSTAAGYGWFVDTTTSDDSEFTAGSSGGELLASESSDAFGHMDLLTVVMHEMGHVLGLEDFDPKAQELMDATLETGVRSSVSHADEPAGEDDIIAAGGDAGLEQTFRGGSLAPRVGQADWYTPFDQLSRQSLYGDSDPDRRSHGSGKDKGRDGSGDY